MSTALEKATFDCPVYPAEIPLFPLSGIILLPGGRLPLNIFESSMIGLIDYALAHGRYIGIIQPLHTKNEPSSLYKIGCLGRIVSFTETEDGRYLINIDGISRFSMETIVRSEASCEIGKVSYQDFESDMDEASDVDFDRARLITAMQNYFKAHGVTPDWESIQKSTDNELITSFSMAVSLAANEKQALLESSGMEERAKLLVSLLEMASLNQPESERARH